MVADEKKATHADPMNSPMREGSINSPMREGTGSGFRTVTFKVPLDGRGQKFLQLKFILGGTILEEDGCVKVKEAEDEHGNRFLMKLILMNELEKTQCSTQVRDRLNTEIGVLKILDHRHIIKLFQVFSADSIVYVLMEKVTTPLSAVMKAHGGKLTEAVAKKYFYQMLEAISYLHGRGLVHRDLCLANMYVDESMEMIKISGFELSCLQSSRDLLTDHPAVDHLYAAPELVGTEPYHGKKADIWSLGCVLHTMLTGKPPYEAGVTPAAPSQLPMPGVPAPVRTLLEKTLDLDWKMGRINLNDLLRDPWVSIEGEEELPLAAESFVGPLGGVGSSGTKGSLASIEADLEASTSRELQESFAKLEGLQLGSGSAGVSPTSLVPPKESNRPPPISPDDSQDVVDESFSPLRERRRRLFTLLDTPLGAHKEIEPLWADDKQAGGLATFELSPRGVSSPSAKTRKTLNFDILPMAEVPALGAPPEQAAQG